jgi:O-antigen/teichoic acid export membrane protein
VKESRSTEGQKTRHLGIRFFSNASVYGIGTALIRVGTFVVMPLYWRVLTPEDFGLIALSQIIIQVLVSLLDLGLSGSIQRHYFEWKLEERPRHLAAVWTFSIIFSTLLCLFLTLIAPWLREFFVADMSLELIYFGVWIAYFQNFGILPFSLCRIREQLPLFSIMSISQFLTQTTSILIFIFAFKMGYHGFLWGTLAGSVLYALISLIFIMKEIRFPWKWWHLREPLAYAMPTAPAAILEGASGILDRFFLQRFVTLDQLGLYSLGRQFGQAYNFFVSSLKNSWVPLTYRLVSERGDAAQVLSRLGTYYLIVLMVPALAISLLTPDLIRWIGNPKYFGIGPFVPYFVLAYVLFGIGNIYGRGLDLAKKTQYYWITYAANFTVNLWLLWLWAPRYGTWGAIAAFLLAGVAREGTLIGLATYFYPRPVDYKSILKITTVNVITYLLVVQLPTLSPLLALLTKALCVFLSALLTVYWVFGGKGFRRVFDFLRRRTKVFENPAL